MNHKLNPIEKNVIPLCAPSIVGNEWKYVKDCLDSGWVSSVGEYVQRFEDAVADYLGRSHAVACINGTAALHTAVLVAGIQPNEEALVPALSFAAVANALRYAGAWPVFIDVDPDTWQMDPQRVKDFLNKECRFIDGKWENRHTHRVIKAILPVHILGHPVDMDPVLKLGKEFGLTVIEDAAESLGALYKDCKVGNLGDVAVLSFNGNKTITCGAGGMLVTNNETFAERARYLTTQAKDDPVEYIHHEIGYNYRLSNLHAAMGLAQMECLDEFVQTKRKIARRYQKDLQDIPGISFLVDQPWARSSCWLYTVLIDQKNFGMASRQLLNYLKEEFIQCRPLWHPLYRLKPFQGCYADKISVADRLYKEGLSLPSSVGLSEENQDRVIEVIVQTAKRKKVFLALKESV